MTLRSSNIAIENPPQKTPFMGISKRHVWFLEGKCPVPNTKCSCSSISHCWPVSEVYPFFKRALGGGGVVLRERVVIWCCLCQGTSCQFKDVLVIFVGKQTAFGQSPFNVVQGWNMTILHINYFKQVLAYSLSRIWIPWIRKTICCKCFFYKFFPKLQGIFQANVILLSENECSDSNMQYCSQECRVLKDKTYGYWRTYLKKNKIVATKCTTCKEELGTWVQDSRILPWVKMYGSKHWMLQVLDCARKQEFVSQKLIQEFRNSISQA